MTNDTRETLPVHGSFWELLKELFEAKQKAAVLYENKGVTRAEGQITRLYQADGFFWLVLDEDITIRVDLLYAVNGLFSPDYSEC